MRLERRSDGSLWITDGLGFLRWLLVAAVGLAGAAAVWLTRIGAALELRGWALLGGIGLLSAMAVLFAPSTEIEIAPWKGQVRLRRRWLFSARERLIASSEVRAVGVAVLRMRHERRRPVFRHRVTLETTGGAGSLVVATLRSEREAEALAGEIRGLLGLAP